MGVGHETVMECRSLVFMCETSNLDHNQAITCLVHKALHVQCPQCGPHKGCLQCSDRGNGAPWISLMRPPPPQIKTGMLNYITKAKHHQKARLESTGMPPSHIPHLRVCLARRTMTGGLSSFIKMRAPMTKPARFGVSCRT